jgi:ATP-dependent DNA helicase RecQ
MVEVPAAASAPLDARAVLRSVFGYDDFRGGQAVAVDALCAGRDAVVLLPTGAGKSLCYQVPAIVAARRGGGTTLVVSPLIALMNDQVAALAGRGVAAAALHSQQDEVAQRAVIASFVRGELALLYVSPERAALASFHRLLARVPIAAIAIDEAHCVSQWGHDFRPEYLRLHELRELAALAAVPLIALTATATPRVMAELVAALALRAPAIVRGDFRRPNLSFAVRHLRSDAARVDAVIAACDAAGLRARTGSGRAIIYCATRKKAEAVADALRSAGFPAGHYHAGRTALARERAQGAFALGRTRVLVATNAFGMGIDHPDVRLIVHAQAPGSLEAYYQEAGRAGRDGAPAQCLLLFGAGDLMTQRRLAQGGARSAAMEQRVEDGLAAIERYAHATRCRQAILCAHFTGPDAAAEDLACGQCDACAGAIVDGACPDEAAAVDPLGDDARRCILDAAAHLRRPIGKGLLAKALRGSRAKGIATHGLDRNPQHGALADADEAAIVATIDQLIRDRRLERRGRRFPTVWLAGRPVTRARGDGAAAERPSRSRGSDLARDLEAFRRRKARELDWKAYMIFQRRTIAAIDRARPRSRDALASIPGLGPAKIARFGDEILALVRRHQPAD